MSSLLLGIGAADPLSFSVGCPVTSRVAGGLLHAHLTRDML